MSEYTLCVLVQDHEGVGEVVDCFFSIDEAIEAGKQLDGEWSIYVREITEDL